MAKSRRKTVDSPAVSAIATLPQSNGGTTAADADRDRIAARAYELYLKRGGGHGMDMDDWLVAERELTRGSNAASERR